MKKEQKPKGEPYTELDLSRDLLKESFGRLKRAGIKNYHPESS